MKIIRKGARANHGLKSVALKLADVRWNSTAEGFDVTFAGSAEDFTTEARHVYRLRFTAAEMATLIGKMGGAAESMGAEEFGEVFGKHSADLYRLHAMACRLKLAA